MLRVVLMVAALALAGCQQGELVVQSDTFWTIDIDVPGSGDIHSVGSAIKSFPMPGGHTCWEAKKTTKTGTLTVWAQWKGSSPSEHEQMGYQTTTAEFGQVSGCANF